MLCLSTAGLIALIALIALAGVSVGLTFLPSAALALVACALALIPSVSPTMRA